MSTNLHSPNALRFLTEDEYYDAQIALALVRAQTALENKELHKRMRGLDKDYEKRRRHLIPATLDREIKEFNHQQGEARQALSTRSTNSQQEKERLKLEYARLEEETHSHYQSLGIDYEALITLREATLDESRAAFLETAGKGHQSVVRERPSGASDADPESHPPFKVSYDECDPPSRVRSSLNIDDGVIAANLRCSLRDCGNSESRAALYRNYWIFCGQGLEGGRLSASIDLQPRHFHSVASVRDNNGSSAVSIERSFRIFAQVKVGEWDEAGFPELADRCYWRFGPGSGVMVDQIISRPTSVSRWPNYSECMPFYYKDQGLNIDSFDSSGEVIGSTPSATTYTGLQVGENVWRYTVNLPDAIPPRQLFTGAIGIEFYNRIWGDDATIYSEIDFEFVTPRIAWEIV